MSSMEENKVWQCLTTMMQLKFGVYMTILLLFGALFLLRNFTINKPIQHQWKPMLVSEPMHHSGTRSRGKCLHNTSQFVEALDKQRQGLKFIRDVNNHVDFNATVTSIPEHFNEIWNAQLERMDYIKLPADASGEMKYFITFAHQQRPIQCNVVTLGVGTLIWAESNISRLYPECQFLAADPNSKKNEELVTKYLGGAFINVAVGGETIDEQTENVLDGGHLLKRKQSQLGIYDFLLFYNFLSPIDLLLIDTEGSEFGIFEQFVDHYDNMPVPLCQINLEVHHQPQLVDHARYQRFLRYFDRLLRVGPFALMHTDSYVVPIPIRNNHPIYHRMFFVNVVDEICVHKFLC